MAIPVRENGNLVKRKQEELLDYDEYLIPGEGERERRKKDWVEASQTQCNANRIWLGSQGVLKPKLLLRGVLHFSGMGLP